jgi:hypothetical protein
MHYLGQWGGEGALDTPGPLNGIEYSVETQVGRQVKRRDEGEKRRDRGNKKKAKERRREKRRDNFEKER